ncbi:MAG: META domain-containing protein [Bacteroidaceae bacterium]|nr:META domain-containing protein [Bacteroidaceae bacterium]MBO5793978.1 META domain-containing protein [Bacteroidaceae bacterium]
MKKTLFSALVACMAFCNCANVKTNKFSTQPDILGQWTIVEANGMSTDSAETTPFILFSDSGRVNGNASVNTFFGQYTLKGDSISFDQLGATMMMGREKDMEVEMAVMAALAQCVTLEVQDSVLNAKDHDGNVVMSLTRN